jgi:5'-deoxynucleotidase YfbR-like HD superfamily hydrolase
MQLHCVRRFQTHRLQAPKSVAEHSFRVAALYAYLGGTEILAALLHDAEEAITGDLPSPIKKTLTGLEKYEALRPQFQNENEKRLGKLADRLELVLDLREQLEDTGKLPKRLMTIYEDELEASLELARELGKIKEVKKLLREIAN